MRRAHLLFGIVIATGCGAIAAAQTGDDPRARLIAAKTAAAAAERQAAALTAAADRETDAAGRARAAAVAADARVRAAEAALMVGRARLAAVRERLSTERGALTAREGPIVRLVAALQAIARRPAVLLLVQPGSISDMVHVRAVLSGAVPAMRARTAGLRLRLAEARRTAAAANVAAAALAGSRRALESERLAAARLAAMHDARAVRYGRSALAASDRAIALGESARDAADLAGAAVDATVVTRRLAALPAPVEAPAGVGGMLPWTADDAPYRLPVAGTVVTGFGELSASGVRSRGLTLRSAPGAIVAAPAAGRIAFAGPFRDYGGIVVVDHGGGWTTLVTGLARVPVRVDAIVEQGQAIGFAAMGERPLVTIELRRRGRAVDFVPLLG